MFSWVANVLLLLATSSQTFVYKQPEKHLDHRCLFVAPSYFEGTDVGSTPELFCEYRWFVHMYRRNNKATASFNRYV